MTPNSIMSRMPGASPSRKDRLDACSMRSHARNWSPKFFGSWGFITRLVKLISVNMYSAIKLRPKLPIARLIKEGETSPARANAEKKPSKLSGRCRTPCQAALTDCRSLAVIGSSPSLTSQTGT